jgi:hypothetical protein
VSLSPQTLEWREEGEDAAGKAVHGPSGEVTLYEREREGAVPVRDAGAVPLPALSAPAGGSSGRDGGFSSKVSDPASQTPTVLTILSRSSRSKNYDLGELRAISGADVISLEKLLPHPTLSERAASAVIVTSRSGAVAVFSFAEISAPGGPSLDVSGAAPRLVAPGGRGLDDVASIELRVLVPAK